MNVTGIGSVPVTSQLQRPDALRGTDRPDGPGFTERMGQALENLNQSQTQASDSARNFELGLENDLAGVMINQQVASLGFQMALNVRNKALGAYRDIMNMPV